MKTSIATRAPVGSVVNVTANGRRNSTSTSKKQNRVEVVVRFELDPGIAGRGDAAFVDGVLRFARFRRLEKSEPHARDRQEDHGKRDGHSHEEGEERVSMRVHFEAAAALNSALRPTILDAGCFLAKATHCLRRSEARRRGGENSAS